MTSLLLETEKKELRQELSQELSKIYQQQEMIMAEIDDLTKFADGESISHYDWAGNHRGHIYECEGIKGYIKIDYPYTIDYGKCAIGGNFEHKLKIKNNLRYTSLSIREFVTTNSELSAKFPKMIQPGDTIDVILVWSPKLDRNHKLQKSKEWNAKCAWWTTPKFSEVITDIIEGYFGKDWNARPDVN